MNPFGYIYLVTNLANGSLYIGCTVGDIERRWRNGHVRTAIKQNGSSHLNRAIRKYGPESFVVEVIDAARTKAEMYAKERRYITLMDTFRDGMNMTEGGDGSVGWKHSIKTRRKFSERLKGNQNAKGMKHSQELKDKMREKMLGNTFRCGKKQPPGWAEAHSKRMQGSKNPMYGRHHTAEVRERMSGSGNPMYGKPSPFKGKTHTEETRRRMSQSLRGKPTWNKGLPKEKNPLTGRLRSEETKQKISRANSNPSAETRKRKSEAAKRRWAKNGRTAVIY